MREAQTILTLKDTLKIKNPPPPVEGKTKYIFESTDPKLVIIESKDNITAGDGTRRDAIPGKGILATQTTVNVFRLLEREGIPTHFVGEHTPGRFIAKEAEMIPVESVARRKATGSFLKRNPEVMKGTVFPGIEHEFFHKNDDAHDPKMVLEDGTWHFYDPSKPEGPDSLLYTKDFNRFGISQREVQRIQVQTREVFVILEEAWAKLGVELIDVKIEFGRDIHGEREKDGEKKLMVADVIDNDSWRIWKDGDEGKDLSKQVYRNTLNPTVQDLFRIGMNYQIVANLTKHFLE